MTDLRFIPINEINRGDRARQDYGDMEALTTSIKTKGLIQPITVDSDLLLLAGGRRLAACEGAGISSVPCLVRDRSNRVDELEVELLENVQRKDLTWQEEVDLTARIHALYKDRNGSDWTQEDTANSMARSTGAVSRHLDLANTISAVPELQKCKTEDDAVKLTKKLLNKAMTKQLRAAHEKEIHKFPIVGVAMTNYKIGDAVDEILDIVLHHRENKTTSLINMIECDPPYGINLCDVKHQKTIDARVDDYQEIAGEKYLDFLSNITEALYDVAAEHCWMIFWYGPTWHTEVKKALKDCGWQVDDIPGIWNKAQGQTNAPDYFLARSYEPFFICWKGRPVLHKKGQSNVLSIPPVTPSKKRHPTQRPEELIKQLLDIFVAPGSIVLSPFLGSGSTWFAAREASMHCFGWDIESANRDSFLVHVKERYEDTTEVED